MKISIPIMNPQRTIRGKRRTGGTAMKTRRRKKRKASLAQLRALAKGRATLARKAKSKSSPRRVKKARRRSRRASSLLSKEGRHRPVVLVRKRRLARPKRSTIPAHASFKNPFLGELAMIGNPHRKRRKGRKSHRRSSRRRSMRLWSNPAGGALATLTSGPREMIKMDFIQDAASVAIGFVLPNMGVAMLPANLRDTRLKVYASKVAVVAGLSAAATMVSKRASRMILLGGGVSLALDLWVDWIAPLMGRGGAAAPAGTGVYYGDSDSGMGVYYGDSASTLSESFA